MDALGSTPFRSTPLRLLVAGVTLSLLTIVPLSVASPAELTPRDRYPITAPKDAPITRTVGALRIDTWNPVTMTPLEDNTHLFFTVTNTADTPRTVEHQAFGRLTVDGHPDVEVTIHRHFGESGNIDDAQVVIPAGASRTLEFSMERFLTGQQPTTSIVPVTFRSVEDGVSATFRLQVTSSGFNLALDNTRTAYISGRVTTPAGKPIGGARVSAGLFAMTNVRSTTTDANGRYRLGVLSLPDVRRLLGPRPLPYGDLGYFVTVDAPGYATVERTLAGPTTGATVTVNARLKPVPQLDYRQTGEFESDGTLAYWWLDFAGDRVVAVQGQHPPVDQRTGHIVAIDLRGRELWRQATGGQCWGFDISPDKTLSAAGCDDGYVYVNRVADGTLLFKRQTGDRPGMGTVGAVDFSPDSRRLAVDGASGATGFSVLDARTGEVQWTSSAYTQRPTEQWAYKLRWSPDGTRIVAGDSGLLTSYTADGQLQWRRQIGYAPFVLDFDAAGNVYVGAKDNMLYSFDPAGSLRWKQTLAQCPQMASLAFGPTAGYLVMPTFSGLLQAFRFDGSRLWQRVMPTLKVNWGPGTWVSGVGHNAFMSTPDGRLMAIATRGYETTVYDRSGNLRWYHVAKARRDFAGEDPKSHGSMTGGQSVAITPDGKTIAVGYADSTIRIFREKP
jgi:WD40 repeat protein